MRLFYLSSILYLLASVCQAQSSDRNYTLTRTYKQINAAESSGNTYAGDPTVVNTQLSYFDGLGQPTQQVNAFAGPAYQDMMSRTEYDNQLRSAKAYLPVAIPNNVGKFINSPDGSWYNSSNVDNPTANYFQQTVYDSSPLNRTTESKAPGVGVGVRQSYLNNLGSSVKRYSISGSTLYDVQYNNTFYSANTLTYTETNDENDRVVQSFQDSYGRTVLKRILITVSGNNISLDTYYIFDQAGKIRAVLQPAYQDDASLDKYAFLYEYNPRGLLYKKKLPGSGISILYYDTRDRLQSVKDSRDSTFYYNYDALNRQIEIGVNGAPLLYTFYDDYNFSGKANFGSFTGVDFTNELSLSSSVDFVSNPQSDNRKGLQTGSAVRILNADGTFGAWKRSVSYYDNKGRLIQTVRQLYGFSNEAIERVSYQYDFANRLVQQRTTQLTGGLPYQLDKLFTYDQADRLVKITHTLKENGVQKKQYVHTQQQYNEIGQLNQKQLHNGIYRLGYKYTARGWLNEQKSTAGIPFSISLHYYDNGNVKDMTSTVNGQGGKTTYDYDGVNRLTGYQTDGNLMGYNEPTITYDKNGNILSLVRNYNNVTIDNLEYRYSGNQLYRVNDTGDNSKAEKGFIDGSASDTEMKYDGNGNLTKDANRGIGDNGISYNVLNLLARVNINGDLVQYTYDANGTKRQMAAPNSIRTTYEGLFEYNPDGTLARISLDEGQLIRGVNGSYSVQYYLKDHVGSTRAVINETGSLNQVTDYYAFGMQIVRQSGDNKYLYNNKEIQPQTRWSDFGARMYDASLGRWMVTDPLAETSRRWTPYNYTYNNPLRFIDPDGMQSEALQSGESGSKAQEDFNYTDGYGWYSGNNSAIGRDSFNGKYTDDKNHEVPSDSQDPQPKPGRLPTNTQERQHQSQSQYQQMVKRGDGIEQSYLIEGQLIGGVALKPLGGFIGRVIGWLFGKSAVTAGVDITNAVWSQKTYSATFSAGGKFANQSVDDVIEGLVNGSLPVKEVPVNVIVREGQTFILNTRSSAALTRAGVDRSSWNVINQTGVGAFEDMLTDQLVKNKLIGVGTSTIRQTGTQIITNR